MFAYPLDSISQLKPSAIYREFLESYELTDVWRKIFPTDPGHSYFHYLVSSRLDVVLVNNQMVPYIKRIQRLPLAWYGHIILVAYFDLPATKFLKSSYLWKFRNSHLQNPEYIALIQDIFRTLTIGNASSTTKRYFHLDKMAKVKYIRISNLHHIMHNCDVNN